MIRFRRCGALLLGLMATWSLLVEAQPASGQQPQRGFLRKVYRDEAGAHRYAVFVPRNYTPRREWPVILFLHGAGESGTDGWAQTSVGLGPYVYKRRDDFPFIVVFPQAEDTRGPIFQRWLPTSPDGRRALAILDEVAEEYNIDRDRQILTGWSMGGYGAWHLAAADPERWAAVAPVSARGAPELAPRLRNLPIWAYHGAQDAVIPVTESRRMVAALREVGADVIYTEPPNLGHDVWRVAYDNDTLDRWMLDPEAVSATEAPLAGAAGRPEGSAPVGTADAPFIPAVHIPRAVYVRLGNEMLETLALSIPQIVPPTALSGRLNDIFDVTSAEGYTFNVRFSGITYSAQLDRAALRAYAPDRLNVQLALRNVQLNIAGTSVAGGRRSAVAGPISIVIGHRYPVWLSFDVTPYIDSQGRIRFRLLGTRFNIPSDNFYVAGPAGVSTQGLGMTEERVSSGLVSGLYGSRARIESEVQAVVPSILAEFEQYLNLEEVDALVSGVWPLPVYQPRVRTWPQEISTDANGITVVLGVTAAAPDPRRAPRQPEWAPPMGPGAKEIAPTREFRAGVAPQILGPLSEMLIDAEMARIHVHDLPVETLHTLADPQFLTEVFPDLERYGDRLQVSAEFVLAEPLRVRDAEEPGEMAFSIRPLLLSLAIKPTPEADEWIPFADVAFTLEQQVRPELQQPTDQTRVLQLNWEDADATVAQVEFARDYQPEDETVNVQRLQQVFTEGWREWTKGGPASQVILPDLDFGLTRLSASDVAWAAPYLTATYDRPGVKVTNSSEQVLIYETRGLDGRWGGPYRLEPGDSDRFDIGYPLIIRYRTDRGAATYTLPPGSHSEYFAPTPGSEPRLFRARERQLDAE